MQQDDHFLDVVQYIYMYMLNSCAYIQKTQLSRTLRPGDALAWIRIAASTWQLGVCAYHGTCMPTLAVEARRR